MFEFHEAIFAWFLRYFGSPSYALGAYTPTEGWDGVGINRVNGAATEIKVQAPSIWTKGLLVGDCSCVIGLGMTILLVDGRKISWNIIIIIINTTGSFLIRPLEVVDGL